MRTEMHEDLVHLGAHATVGRSCDVSTSTILRRTHTVAKARNPYRTYQYLPYGDAPALPLKNEIRTVHFNIYYLPGNLTPFHLLAYTPS